MKNLAAIFLIFNFYFSFSQSQSTLLGSQTSNQLNTITTAVPFLLISPNARAGGLGDAGCASTPDVWSNYWNASKNAFIEKNNGIAFSYTPWLKALVPDIRLFDMSLYKKIGKKSTLSFSARYFSLGCITFTNIVGNVIGEFHPYEHTENISFSHKMKHNFSFGIAGKYIFSQLTNSLVIGNSPTHAGQSLAMDVSCYKRDTINFIRAGDVFAWGINISNVGSKISYDNSGRRDFLPQNLRIGISYKVDINAHNSIELICDANKLLVPSPPIYAVDSAGNPIKGSNGQFVISKGKDPNRSVFNALYSSFYDAPGGYKEELREINIASGIEYWCYKTVAARLGYFFEDPTKGGRKYFTAGIGLRYEGIELDGSYIFHAGVNSSLQHTWRVSLAYEFDRFRKIKNQ